MTRPRTLRLRALAGRFLYRTGSTELRCAGDGLPWHVRITDDGFAGLAKDEPCQCFKNRLRAALTPGGPRP